MDLGMTSLLVFAVLIVVSYVKNVNLGMLSLGAAVVMGSIGKLTAAQVYNGTNLNVLWLLMGNYMFAAACMSNDSLGLMSKKILRKIKVGPKLFPVVAYVFTALFCMLGPSLTVGMNILPMVTMSMAMSIGANVFLTGIMTSLGTLSAFGSPLCSSAMTVYGIAASSGYTGLELQNFASMLISGLVSALVMYGWFSLVVKAKEQGGGKTEDISELPSFTPQQITTILSLLAYILIVIFLRNWHVGFVGFALVAILVMLGAVDEKAVFQRVPWGIVVLVAGTGVYMSVCTQFGAVKILSSLIRALSNSTTVAGIYQFTGGFISLFTYAVAVPIPTLMPTIKEVMTGMGLPFIHELEAVAALQAGSFITTISPLSMTGATVLGCWELVARPDIKTRTQFFNQQLAWSIIVTALTAAFAMTGVYRLFIKV